MLFPRPLIALVATLALEAVALPHSVISLKARKPLPVPSLPSDTLISGLSGNDRDHRFDDDHFRDDNRFDDDRFDDDRDDRDNRFRNDEFIQVTEFDLKAIIQNDDELIFLKQKVQQVLVLNQDNSRRRNNRRRNWYRRNRRDNTSVLLIVQKIKIVNIERSAVTEAFFFAQSAIIANRGRRRTDTFMLFAEETLVIDGRRGINDDNRFGIGSIPTRVGGIGSFETRTTDRLGVALETGSSNQRNETAQVSLLGVQPTWSSISPDVPDETAVPLPTVTATATAVAV